MSMLATLHEVTQAASVHASLMHAGGGDAVILAGNIPNGDATAPEEVMTKVNTLVGLAKYGGLAAGVGGVIMLGISLVMANKGRGGGEDHGKGAIILGIGLMLIGTPASIVGFLIN